MITDFRLGGVLAKSLSVLIDNFVSFITITLIVNTPVIVVGVLDSRGLIPRTEGILDSVILLLVTTLFALVVTGAITFGVIQQLHGQHVSVEVCVSTGFSRLSPVIEVVVCVALATAVGLVCFIIPGFIILSMLWVAVPVAVVEHVGVRDAINRSQHLTKGNRLKIIGILLLFAWFANSAERLLAASVENPVWLVVMTLGTQFLLGTWLASASAVSYVYLRSIKESVDIDRIASGFDEPLN